MDQKNQSRDLQNFVTVVNINEMEVGEAIYLKWDQFIENIKETSDVTLACEDKEIRAHT